MVGGLIRGGGGSSMTDAEVETAYNNQVDIVAQAAAEAGTDTTAARWTAQRVSQAIAALAPAGGSGDAEYTVVYTSLTALKAAVIPANGTVAMLTGNAASLDGGFGVFKFDTSDLSADVTVDTEAAVYVPPNSDTTGASGAWVRHIEDNILRGRWWVPDTTGATNAQTEIEAAMTLALHMDLPLALPEGHLLFTGSNIFHVINEDQTFRMFSEGETTVQLEGMNLRFKINERYTENLAADMPQHATILTLADTATVRVGDLVRFKNTAEVVETGWDYDKFAIRQVQDIIDDTTVRLDEPMSLPFSAFEGNTATVSGITQANPCVVTTTENHNRSNGDYVQFEDTLGGMVELVGNTYKVANKTGKTFELHNTSDVAIDSTGYTAFNASPATHLQGATTVDIFPPAYVDIRGIDFLVDVTVVDITAINISTGQITATGHGLTTGDYLTIYDVGGTEELNKNSYRATVVDTDTITLTDLDSVAIDTTGYTTYTSGGVIHRNSVSNNTDYSVIFEAVSGHVEDCEFRGAIPQWEGEATDIAIVTGCNKLSFDRCDFILGRYCPLINAGSRFTKIANGRFESIRHADAAGFAQDTHFYNMKCFNTEGIIECHPSIRTKFEEITDGVTNANNAAINLRGFGEIVINSTSESTDGVSAGTTGPTVHSDYDDWAATFTRRFENFRSRTAAIPGGRGDIVIRNCDVPYIYDPTGSSFIDDATKLNWDVASIREKPSSMDTTRTASRVTLPKVSRNASERPYGDITGATQANPCVITATAHGLVTGQLVTIEDVAGMTELNSTDWRDDYTITVIDANSFSLDGENSTGYGAYTSGGEWFAMPEYQAITNITQANPGVVTITAHNFSDGDIIWVSGVGGMTEATRSFYTVANSAANTFELTDIDGANVDTSAYTAYTSGGVATKQAAWANTIDLVNKPAIGFKDGPAKSQTLIHQESAHSDLTVDVPFLIHPYDTDSLLNHHYSVKIKVKASCRRGYAEESYVVMVDTANMAASNCPILDMADSKALGGCSVRLKGIHLKNGSEIQDEGDTGSNVFVEDEINHRWGIHAVAEVTVSGTSDWVYDLTIEVDSQKGL